MIHYFISPQHGHILLLHALYDPTHSSHFHVGSGLLCYDFFDCLYNTRFVIFTSFQSNTRRLDTCLTVGLFEGPPFTLDSN